MNDNDLNKKDNIDTSKKSFGQAVASVFKTIWSWIKRMFYGASKSLKPKEKEISDKEKFNVEEIISPSKQIVQNFFRRKYAVVALSVIIFMFIFTFVGPLFMTKYDDAYTSTTQKNIEPNLTLLKVPSGLKNNMSTASSKSFFTFALDNDGKIYNWGISKMNASGVDVSIIPEEAKDKEMAFIACGTDHVVAIGKDGKIYAWGSHKLGQFVKDEEDLEEQLSNSGIEVMPEEFRFGGTIDVDNVKKLVCGTQATAILMKDGTLYLWGNKKTYSNMPKFKDKKFHDICFTLTHVVGITEDQKQIFSGISNLYDKLKSDVNSQAINQANYIKDNKINSITSTNSGVAILLDNGSVFLSGDFQSRNLVSIPKKMGKEKVVQLSSGIEHYLALTENGNVYAWGDNTFDQCEIKTNTKVDKIIGASYQTYLLNEEGKVVYKTGLKGYIFGTDENGSDLFQRLISGGKMTLTIGAVAVIISTIIGIIVGVISGYFGGWVDMFLMRVEEIVASIPFLPFAMILSALIGSGVFGEVSENMRIFVIMLILGLLSWTGLARLVRGEVLAARENEYVVAARAMGVKEIKIAFKHILPNVISVIIVTLTLDFAGCMLTESSLSYLGFGVQYPKPTWGNMLNATTTLTKIANYWWQWLFPGLFLAITTICINIVGDTLRDVMDPKSNER